MKTFIYTVITLFLIQALTTEALVVGNIKIVGRSGGITQYLPGSYINTIPKWTIESSANNNEKTTISLKQLIGSGSQQQENDKLSQFVNPLSNEELWWPSDLNTIQIRPTLDVFMNSASPSYLLAGLEVRVPPVSSKDGKAWTNFGMNSQLLATQWTSFDIAVENGFRVEAFIGKVQKNHMDDDNNGDDDNNIDWEPLNDEQSCYSQKNTATSSTFDAIGLLGGLLAELDQYSPLATGMHIVSIPIDYYWRDLPAPNLEKNEKIRIASIGTVEPDAMELLSMDESLVAMSATSVLDVEVIRIAAGSESEYIPNVYKPLYIEQ